MRKKKPSLPLWADSEERKKYVDEMAAIPTDLSKLHALLVEERIPHRYREHVGAKEMGTGGVTAKDILGYVPSGTHQIILLHPKPKKRGEEVWLYSIIRGMVSFGDFEIYDYKKKDVMGRFTREALMIGFIKRLSYYRKRKKRRKLS